MCKLNFAKLFRFLGKIVKNGVIIQGFADHGEANASGEDATCEIIKNIQPISVGV
jgi:hypothetical protein